MANPALIIWVVYNNPLDFPGQLVAREFIGEQPTAVHKADTDLSIVLDWILERAVAVGKDSQPVMLPRETSDDPCIVYSFF